MKKRDRLKLLGFVGIITLAFVFIGLSLVQGQVMTKGKPAKPPGQDKEPEYAWSALILEGPMSSIQGEGANSADNYTYVDVNGDRYWGWLYGGSESNINFRVRTVETGTQGTRSNFCFEIFYPVNEGENLYQIDFIADNIANQTAEFVTDPPNIDPDLNPGFTYKTCRFPVCGGPGINCDDASCLFDFIQNWPHPFQGYEKVGVGFYSIFSFDLNEGDYENWALFDKKNMWLDIVCRAQEIDDGDFKIPNLSDYNTVGFNSGGEQYPYGYFERISPDVWKVVAGRDILGADLQYNDDINVNVDESYLDFVWEQYRKNKFKEVAAYFYPTIGSCDMKFEVLFIRTQL